LAAQTEGKIAVMNMNGAIGSTALGKKAIADLQKKYTPRQQEIQQLQKDVQSLQEQLNKQPSTLSDDDQRRMARELEDKQTRLKRATDDMQSDYTADMDETARRLAQKMVPIIADYAQKNGFVLVIDAAQMPVYFAAKEIYIQGDLVKLFDAANPVAGAAATSPGAAK
jgi:outer membrane protein